VERSGARSWSYTQVPPDVGHHVAWRTNRPQKGRGKKNLDVRNCPLSERGESDRSIRKTWVGLRGGGKGPGKFKLKKNQRQKM